MPPSLERFSIIAEVYHLELGDKLLFSNSNKKRQIIKKTGLHNFLIGEVAYIKKNQDKVVIFRRKHLPKTVI